VGTRTVAVEQDSLHSYEGGWPEYVRIRDEARAASQADRSSSDHQSARPHAGVPGTAHVRSHGGAHAPLRQVAHVPPGTENGSASPREEPRPKRKPKPKGPSKNRLNDQQKAERAIEEAEAAMRALEDELADPAAWATQYESAKSTARHTAARRAVEQAYARLESLID
jgi:ATP-binding cassette, subfamily F, member 3